MVWIYGGAFNTGSGIRTKYSPDYFMQENIILVTFNYRLSSLGFLSLADPKCEVAGNAGLKDQVLALKWVKENISYFGGDNENITVFGESAGSASVHYMTICEQTRGLFQKTICMSGVVKNPWAYSDSTTHLPYRLACEKGYNGPNEDKLVLDYLEKLPAEELVLVDKLNLEAVNQGGFYAFVPSLEPYSSENAVISKPLDELIANAWGNQLPMLIGGTSFEGLVRYSQIKKKNVIELYNENPELYFPLKLRKILMQHNIEKLVEQLKELHFKNTTDVMGFMDVSLNILKILKIFLNISVFNFSMIPSYHFGWAYILQLNQIVLQMPRPPINTFLTLIHPLLIIIELYSVEMISSKVLLMLMTCRIYSMPITLGNWTEIQRNI